MHLSYIGNHRTFKPYTISGIKSILAYKDIHTSCDIHFNNAINPIKASLATIQTLKATNYINNVY